MISWLKGSNPRVVSGYDPVDDVYYVSFEAVPTHLPDGRTLGYNNKIKAWQGEYTFVPQHYGTVRNSFYLLDEVGTNRKLVHVYGDNENSNLFYDSSNRATSKVTVVSNAKPSAVKAYESISLEGESEWTVTLESSTGQTTEELSFSEREGTFYANVTGDNSSNSFRHLIPVGKVASTDGSTITMQNSLKGIHIPNGYTIFKTSTGGVKPVTTGETVGGVDRSAKTITASGGGHGLSNSDVLYVAGNQAVNGDQIRGHYCKIKCSKTPAPVDTARHELYAINAKVTESKNHQRLRPIITIFATMSVLGTLALQFGPSLVNAALQRRNDRRLYENIEGFYGGLRSDARTQMDESMAAREAAKKDIGVGETYKKYLDMAMQDPMADFQRKEAMRSQAESIGALKSGGARALLGGLQQVQSGTTREMDKIAAGEQDRKLGALKTFGAIEQQQDNMRINQMLRDARGDLGLARTQYGDAMMGQKQAEIDNLRSKQEFLRGIG